MSLVDLIPGLNSLLDTLQRERHHREVQADAALTALYAAATETKLYLLELEDGGRRSKERERGLSRLWSRAAVPIRRFDADLADRSLRKSEYWMSPARWTSSMVTEARIGIDQVQEDALKLLKLR